MVSEKVSIATEQEQEDTDFLRRHVTNYKEFLESFPQKAPESYGPGYPGNLTAEQQSKLEELRAELEAAGYKDRLDDATVLRFLRARKFDIAKAKEMYEACEKWRAEFGTNTILTDFQYVEKPVVAKFYPQFYHKTDKDGRPVYVEQLGSVKVAEMYKITSQERMLQNLVWEYEAMCLYRLPACSRKMGHLVETSCTIMDLKGISLSTASQVYSYIREASVIGQNYYPERMGKFYLINAPFGFAAVFNFIKKFLDPITVEKIHVLGSRYQSELLAQVPVENLPKKFGGTSDSRGGVELADDGPWREEKYVGPEGFAPVAGGIVQEKPAAVPAKTDKVPAPAAA